MNINIENRVSVSDERTPAHQSPLVLLWLLRAILITIGVILLAALALAAGTVALTVAAVGGVGWLLWHYGGNALAFAGKGSATLAANVTPALGLVRLGIIVTAPVWFPIVGLFCLGEWAFTSGFEAIQADQARRHELRRLEAQRPIMIFVQSEAEANKLLSADNNNVYVIDGYTNKRLTVKS